MRSRSGNDDSVSCEGPRTVVRSAVLVSHPGRNRDQELAVGIEIGPAALLELLFGLIADACATGSADSAADHGTRRPGDGSTDRGACRAATECARAGSGLVVTLGSLAGDRAAHGARRATDRRADRCARQGAATGPERLGTALVVILDRLAAIHRPIHGVPVEGRIERIDVAVVAPRVVAVHMCLLDGAGPGGPLDRTSAQP